MKQDSRKTRGVRESGWLTRTKNNDQQGRERRKEKKKDGMQYAMLFLSIEGTMSCFFFFFVCGNK